MLRCLNEFSETTVLDSFGYGLLCSLSSPGGFCGVAVDFFYSRSAMSLLMRSAMSLLISFKPGNIFPSMLLWEMVSSLEEMTGESFELHEDMRILGYMRWFFCGGFALSY